MVLTGATIGPRVHHFDDASARAQSLFNDVRFAHGHAVISDSGPGAIFVDLDTGKVRRLLDGHASPKVEPMSGGRPEYRLEGYLPGRPYGTIQRWRRHGKGPLPR